MAAPSPPARILTIATMAAGLALTGCERQAETPAAPSAATPTTITAPDLPRPPPALGRAELLQAFDEAASAHAAGAQGAATDVAGRRFTIRQAFGCSAPAPAEAASPMGSGRPLLLQGTVPNTLELTLQPADWTQSPLVGGGAATWEAVEGFWLSWPWLRSEGCPVQTAADAGIDAPAPPDTAGLAAVFEHGSSRLTRRDGRAFRHVVRGDAPVQAPPAGYRLVLEGRFVAFPDGRALRCSASPQARPVCVAAAEIDRVAFEDDQGALLSEWRRD